jgi:O-acetyl-ADP-ribose deacetylase (regulator of RNase III)
MIRVVEGDEWRDCGVEAILCSVGRELAPITPAEARLAREGGDDVQRRLTALGDLPVGGAIVTPGGGLPVAFLIHVVIQAAGEPVTVAGVTRAFHNGLRQAAEWGVERVAVPPLGVGAGNLDAEIAAGAMFEALRRHRMESLMPREVIVFVSGEYEADAFRRAATRFDPDTSARQVGL